MARPLDPSGSRGRAILGRVRAWGRWLQSRQPVALLLLLLGFTVAMVGGVLASWPVIASGVVAMLGVLVPMTLARRSTSRHGRP
jgi:hypothetical protein